MKSMYGDGDAISRDMNSLLYSSTFKHPSDGEFAKIKQLISLDPHKPQNQNEDEVEDEGSLTRYRSAPTSFLANLLNENKGCEDFLDPDETFFTQQQPKSESFLTPSKQETKEAAKQHLPPPSVYGGSSSSFTHINSNLIRQTSSPAGFMSSSTTANGFGHAGKGGSSSRSSSHISFSSASRFLPQIAENGNEMNISTFNYSLKRSRDGDSKMFSNLDVLDAQNGDSGHYTPSLVHHISLPKTSSEMAAVEKFLQFQQESVPCKIRAKRGFATHPRSIAERVRRTRISERMKKLQELFPNMDKQINTAEMLDMVVEYIKDLQKEVQTLNDARARCMCSSKQLQSGSKK